MYFKANILNLFVEIFNKSFLVTLFKLLIKNIFKAFEYLKDVANKNYVCIFY